MANFFQKEKFLPYETSLIAKTDVSGQRGQRVKVTPEIIKSGADKNQLTTDGANRGTLLEIIPMHIKNPPRITFMAFLDGFTDTINPDFNSPQVYGRSDPYHIWKSSRRTISLTWVIPSSGKNMALRNLSHISWFMASLYPAYKETSTGSNAVSASPLFRVKYANMLMSANYSAQGLLCTISGVQLSHNKKAGFIPVNPAHKGPVEPDTTTQQDAAEWGDESTGVAGEGTPLDDVVVAFAAGDNPDLILYDQLIGDQPRPGHLVIPVEYKITCKLNIIHEHSLGWTHETGEWRSYGANYDGGGDLINESDLGSRFPYGLELDKGLRDDGSAVTSECYTDRNRDAAVDQGTDCFLGPASRETATVIQDLNKDARADPPTTPDAAAIAPETPQEGPPSGIK